MLKEREINTYHKDYQLWLHNQMDYLRAGLFNKIDVEHMLEEMEDMGASLHRALSSHLIILLARLLKWQFQPAHRCSSWQGSIVEQRVQIENLLETPPSLTRLIPEVIAHAYPKALKIATKEIGLAISVFPATSPYSLDQVMDDEFWPE